MTDQVNLTPFIEVVQGIWRGPRPKPSDYNNIKTLVKAVISLEGLEEDNKEVRELAPVPIVSFPISTLQIYVTGISQEYLDRILNEIDAAPKPVLVHCQHGEDRTGLVIAAYRVRKLGWTKPAAFEEAIKLGYREPINFGLNRTWRGFK